MGGTLNGEIYQYITDDQRKQLEQITNQELISLTKREVDLAKLLDKEDRSPIFAAKAADSNINIEEEIKDFLKKKGIILKE